MKNVKSFDQFVNESVNESNYPSFQSNKNIRYQDMNISSGYWTYTGKEMRGKGLYKNVENNQTYLLGSDDIEYFKKQLKDIEVMESVDEGIIFREETITIKNEINYFVDAYFSNDSGTDEEQLAEEISNDLNLMKGNIEYERRYFEVRGETKGGNQLLAYQAGEFDMYGGPYEPKMQKPTVTLNKKNITPQVMKAFKKYGWDGDMIDISRTDIWGHIIK